MAPMFEKTIDTFFIPKSHLPDNGPIYLAKEDNVSSEQTFSVVVQASSSVPPGQDIRPATINVDYRLNAANTYVVLQFGPKDQRINIPFILSPEIPPTKVTEAFLVSSAPVNTAELLNGTIVAVPTFQNPITLSAESFVIIKG